MNFEFSKGERFNEGIEMQKACTILILARTNSAGAYSFCKLRASVRMLKQCEIVFCTSTFGARECKIMSRRNMRKTSYAVS
jgi:hypothetical protein